MFLHDILGVLKFVFGKDVPPQTLKVDAYKYQFFKKKLPIHLPIGPIWGQIWAKSPDFSKFFKNFGSNLGKFWKINPFIYQILHFIRCHLHTKWLILLPMLAAHGFMNLLYCVHASEFTVKGSCGWMIIFVHMFLFYHQTQVHGNKMEKTGKHTKHYNALLIAGMTREAGRVFYGNEPRLAIDSLFPDEDYVITVDTVLSAQDSFPEQNCGMASTAVFDTGI